MKEYLSPEAVFAGIHLDRFRDKTVVELAKEIYARNEDSILAEAIVSKAAQNLELVESDVRNFLTQLRVDFWGILPALQPPKGSEVIFTVESSWRPFIPRPVNFTRRPIEEPKQMQRQKGKLP